MAASTAQAAPSISDDAAQRKATVARLKAQMLEAHYTGSLDAGLRQVV